MFKRLFLVLACLLLTANMAMAGGVKREVIAKAELTNSSNTTNAGAVYIQDIESPCFIVYNDETDGGSELNTTVGLVGSYDNTTWFNVSWYDYAGGTTLQTSESMASDATYFMWLDDKWSIPYVNITLTSDALTSANVTNVTVYLTGKQ